MGLTKCKDCGGGVSKRADEYPHCGARLKKRWYETGPLLGVIFILLFSVCCISTLAQDATAATINAIFGEAEEVEHEVD